VLPLILHNKSFIGTLDSLPGWFVTPNVITIAR